MGWIMRLVLLSVLLAVTVACVPRVGLQMKERTPDTPPPVSTLSREQVAVLKGGGSVADLFVRLVRPSDDPAEYATHVDPKRIPAGGMVAFQMQEKSVRIGSSAESVWGGGESLYLLTPDSLLTTDAACPEMVASGAGGFLQAAGRYVSVTVGDNATIYDMQHCGIIRRVNLNGGKMVLGEKGAVLFAGGVFAVIELPEGDPAMSGELATEIITAAIIPGGLLVADAEGSIALASFATGQFSPAHAAGKRLKSAVVAGDRLSLLSTQGEYASITATAQPDGTLKLTQMKWRNIGNGCTLAAATGEALCGDLLFSHDGSVRKLPENVAEGFQVGQYAVVRYKNGLADILSRKKGYQRSARFGAGMPEGCADADGIFFEEQDGTLWKGKGGSLVSASAKPGVCTPAQMRAGAWYVNGVEQYRYAEVLKEEGGRKVFRRSAPAGIYFFFE